MEEKSTYLQTVVLVNLSATRGQGLPAEIMGMSFAVQALSAKYILENDLPVGVTKAPYEIDYNVASMKLKAMGIEIDSLTDKQKLTWRTGKKEHKLVMK